MTPYRAAIVRVEEGPEPVPFPKPTLKDIDGWRVTIGMGLLLGADYPSHGDSCTLVVLQMPGS